MKIILTLAALVLLLLAATDSHAEIKNVRMGVNGVTCPT